MDQVSFKANLPTKIWVYMSHKWTFMPFSMAHIFRSEGYRLRHHRCGLWSIDLLGGRSFLELCEAEECCGSPKRFWRRRHPVEVWQLGSIPCHGCRYDMIWLYFHRSFHIYNIPSGYDEHSHGKSLINGGLVRWENHISMGKWAINFPWRC